MIVVHPGRLANNGKAGERLTMDQISIEQTVRA